MNILIVYIVINLFPQYTFGQSIEIDDDNVPSNRLFDDYQDADRMLPLPKQLCVPTYHIQTPQSQYNMNRNAPNIGNNNNRLKPVSNGVHTPLTATEYAGNKPIGGNNNNNNLQQPLYPNVYKPTFSVLYPNPNANINHNPNNNFRPITSNNPNFIPNRNGDLNAQANYNIISIASAARSSSHKTIHNDSYPNPNPLNPVVKPTITHTVNPTLNPYVKPNLNANLNSQGNISIISIISSAQSSAHKTIHKDDTTPTVIPTRIIHPTIRPNPMIRPSVPPIINPNANRNSQGNVNIVSVISSAQRSHKTIHGDDVSPVMPSDKPIIHPTPIHPNVKHTVGPNTNPNHKSQNNIHIISVISSAQSSSSHKDINDNNNNNDPNANPNINPNVYFNVNPGIYSNVKPYYGQFVPNPAARPNIVQVAPHNDDEEFINTSLDGSVEVEDEADISEILPFSELYKANEGSPINYPQINSGIYSKNIGNYPQEGGLIHQQNPINSFRRPYHPIDFPTQRYEPSSDVPSNMHVNFPNNEHLNSQTVVRCPTM